MEDIFSFDIDTVQKNLNKDINRRRSRRSSDDFDIVEKRDPSQNLLLGISKDEVLPAG